MISKMKPVADKPETKDIIEGGSRIAIILSGSPLFSGQAGSGESEIRKWIIENDLLEGIVAMPDQMFYNTGIGTYIWIISNRKDKKSKGLVRLVDARDLGTKMRKSLGDKRNEVNSDAIEQITALYSTTRDRQNDSRVKVMKNEQFGFARLTVERPLRRIWRVDAEILSASPAEIRSRLERLHGQTFETQKSAEEAFVSVGIDGQEVKSALKAIATSDPMAAPLAGKKYPFEPDPDLRDFENIKLPTGFIEMTELERKESVRSLGEEHLVSEILPYASDAWIDHGKTKIGYEVPFTRQFYTYTPPRSIVDIRSEIESLELQIQDLMRGLE
jgi:type I restriction enzyme M protein